MAKGKRIVYTPEQLQFVSDNCIMPRKELTEAFNEKFGTSLKRDSIKSLCTRNGWNTGRTGLFEKEHKPWNTGTKGLMKPNSGSFQKGQAAHNANEVGHERICSKDGYILVKVNEPDPHTTAKTRYRAKQLVVWEKANGPVPKGKAIRFKDGNRLNCALDNLECVSRALNLRLNKNRLNQQPEELKPVIRTLSQLEVATFDATKRTEQS